MNLGRVLVRSLVAALVTTGAVAAASAVSASAQAPSAVVVSGDAIPRPLDDRVGDPAAGRRIVLDREVGNCLICHRVPERNEFFQGDVGPNLAGVGGRLSVGQIRLRLVDISRLNPATVMPPYYRVDRLRRVAARYQGKPVLDAQQIEDVVAYLKSLEN